LISAQEVQESVRTTDGFDLFCRHWKPVREAEKVIIGVHGWGRNSEYFGTLGEALCENGVEVYAPDLRGFGNSVEKGLSRGDVSSYKRHLQDLDETVNHVRGRHPGKKVFMVGHSIGGNYALWYAANHPESLDGIVLAAPAVESTLKLPPALMVKGLFTRVFSPGRLLRDDGIWPEAVRDSADVKFYQQNPLDAPAVSMRFAMPATRTMQGKALEYGSRTRTPTLIIQGDPDNMTLPIGAQKLLETIPAKDKSLQTFTNADHFFYHLFFPRSDFQDDPAKQKRVITTVSDWINAH
jgi:alpha-beta hydrolase superfamily lysophospholipase